ncbi:MAG: hypothetical protein A2Y65_06300 [Deltaproteobacteria bacterium RBG_13_52_11]|nr:MAG: hypothetical protein A2Y65_06300 [Deltaproteobacteria bacterium RBG_13_52_11]
MKFKSYLENLFLKENPDLIAEELNEDAIKKWNALGSLARETARHLGIRHLFCDPDLEERKALGIKCFKEIAQELGYGSVLTSEQSSEVKKIEKTHWEKRERFWLGKLIEKQFDKCIFLVGADHVDHFNTLLTAHGFRSAIVERDWQP